MAQHKAGDGAILTSFVTSAEELAALVQDLSERELDLHREPGGWTVRQIIHHVSDDCDVWSMCIKKALATPGAVVRFEGFPGNEPWADALAFGRRDVGPAVRLIQAHRDYLAQILVHFGDAWDRSIGVANAEGEVVREISVREMVVGLADHMLEHVATIKRMEAGGGESSESAI